jgi:hypothetical protein
MASKFDPAPFDKHAADLIEAAAADREMHSKLRSGSRWKLSGLRSAKHHATFPVRSRQSSASDAVALAAAPGVLQLVLSALSAHQRPGSAAARNLRDWNGLV